MNMTHYMQLLADNQPWNLLIFMAIPIVLAETLAITELYILLPVSLMALFIISIVLQERLSACISFVSLPI